MPEVSPHSYSRANLVAFYISKAHNYVGHFGQAAGTAPIESPHELECVEGKGFVGDRYFARDDHHKGQATFFSQEVFDRLSQHLQTWDKDPSVLRRNIITRGIDLNDLIGKEFSVEGIRFFGTEECHPCLWMNEAFAPGAEAFLKGNGGLRARILNSGTLRL